MTAPRRGSQLIILDAPTLLEALQACAGTYTPPRRPPMPDDQLEYLAACDAKAEALKHEREAGVSGAESDRRAGLDEDARQRANDRFAS